MVNVAWKGERMQVPAPQRWRRPSPWSPPGRFVVVLDDADRENEADLIMAADQVTPEALAFMVRHTSGLVCVGMTGNGSTISTSR